jgi:hypothetical protein
MLPLVVGIPSWFGFGYGFEAEELTCDSGLTFAGWEGTIYLMTIRFSLDSAWGRAQAAYGVALGLRRRK